MTVIEDRVLLLLWVLAWLYVWVGGKSSVPSGSWVRHGKLSDVDVAAVLVAGGMLAFSFAPSYTFADRRTGDPVSDCAGLTDPTEHGVCVLQNFELWKAPTGYNAWHTVSTGLPAALVVAVGALVLVRGLLPIIPAVLVRIATRILLLLASLVFGWAIFNPSTEIFQSCHYGWGLWASLGCLVLMSLMAMSSPPRFLGWLIT